MFPPPDKVHRSCTGGGGVQSVQVAGRMSSECMSKFERTTQRLLAIGGDRNASDGHRAILISRMILREPSSSNACCELGGVGE